MRYAGNPLAVIMMKLFNLCYTHFMFLTVSIILLLSLLLKIQMEIMTLLITIDLFLVTMFPKVFELTYACRSQ